MAKTGTEAITTWTNYTHTSRIDRTKKRIRRTLKMFTRATVDRLSSSQTQTKSIMQVNIIQSMQTARQTAPRLFFLMNSRIIIKSESKI